jgi:glycosyltransferase involved in cell wall biosynthesis
MAVRPPLVSVLVTVYNREAYLEATLHSILSSTFEGFEVIVADDCSTDRSVSLACKAAQQDTRIRCFVNERNLGDYANRNRAASVAKGKYLKYLDADDLIYRHSLSAMVDAMEQFPSAALALSRNVIDPEEPYPKLYSPKEFFREHYFGRSPIGVGPSAAIIRRECFEAVGGFSGRQFVGDTELWMKLVERWPIVTLPPALVWWRQHEGQQMKLELKRPEVVNIRYRLEMEALEATANLSGNEKHVALDRLKRRHARRLLSLALRDRRLVTALNLFSESDLTCLELLGGFRGDRTGCRLS